MSSSSEHALKIDISALEAEIHILKRQIIMLNARVTSLEDELKRKADKAS